jgi:mRNA-degrading endonuclease toxin of MazEF toxin-antitoxin module
MRRGEIWLYNANPTLGDEISKIRPAIIVRNEDLIRSIICGLGILPGIKQPRRLFHII